MKWGLSGWIGFTGMFLMWAVVSSVWADEVILKPSIAVREEYNDNIFFDYEQGQEDYITTLMIGLDFRNRTERRDFKLNASMEPFFYQDNRDLDETNVNVLADLNYLLTPRLKTRLDGFYRIDNRPDRDIETTGLVFGSNERDSYHAAAAVDLALHEAHSVSLAYAYDQEDWRGDGPQRQDFEGHTLNLGYDYNMSRWLEATHLLLNVGLGRYNYETAQIENIFATVGIESMLNERFRFRVSGGARFSDAEYQVQRLVLIPPATLALRTETLDNEAWDGIGNLGLDYLGERTHCSLSLHHDLRTAGGSQGASNLTRLTLNLNYRLLEKLTIGLSGGYYLNKAEADEFAADEVEKHTISVRPLVRWEFLDHFNLEASYRYSRVKDEIADSTAERHMVYLQVGFGFDLLE